MRDLTFHANMFQIHGGGLSRGALLNFMDVSGIEALPSTRLYEAWFERKWGTMLALRAGQLAADTEFMTAQYTEVFTNASLGWPAGLSLNLPNGGPSPPLAALGARLRADITDNLTVLGAIFNGDSAGPRGRPAALQPLWCQLSHQRPAARARRNAISLERKKRRPGTGRKVEARRMAPFRDV
ncbi:hypothetical protein ABIF62_006844 [Bradyrhizobium japonicum]